jgi:hypothetical protein
MFILWEPDEVGKILGTGFMRFQTDIGVDGLATEDGEKFELLAVRAMFVRHGRFREFIRQLKEHYKTICVWHPDNPILPPVLERYGFKPDLKIMGDGEVVKGYRWDK